MKEKEEATFENTVKQKVSEKILALQQHDKDSFAKHKDATRNIHTVAVQKQQERFS
jgi:hypothetical protein